MPPFPPIEHTLVAPSITVRIMDSLFAIRSSHYLKFVQDRASFVTSSRIRPLFMEQMGNIDIVKRAFKTFQNRFNQLPSSDGTSTRPKHQVFLYKITTKSFNLALE